MPVVSETPEQAAKRRERQRLAMRRRRSRPGFREAEKMQRKSPEARAKRREYEAQQRRNPATKARLVANQAKWRAKPESREYMRMKAARSRFKKLGLPTPDDLEELRQRLGIEACEICDRPSWRRASNGVFQQTALSIDHDHNTNAVRGYLCAHCNLVLGHADDDPERLLLAAQYLLDRAAMPVSAYLAQ